MTGTTSTGGGGGGRRWWGCSTTQPASDAVINVAARVARKIGFMADPCGQSPALFSAVYGG